MRWIILVLIVFAGTALAQQAEPPEEAPGIGWQEAVARLAHERTRAETCVKFLKRYGNEDQVAGGELIYDEARAEMDAVIAGLVVALAQDAEPVSLPDLKARLERGVAGREALCAKVKPLVPDTDGQKNVFVDLLTGAIGPLKQALHEFAEWWIKEDRLTKETIRTQLEATKWPAFASIES